MDVKNAIEVYEKIIGLYNTGMYRQEDIAKTLNVPIEIVASCTKWFGYHHTKALNGVRGVYYTTDPFFLELSEKLKFK